MRTRIPVELYIKMNSWSTARKTVMLAVVTLPVHLLGWLSIWILSPKSTLADLGVVHLAVAIGAAALTISLICGLICLRIGAEGRWTGYLVATLYGGYVMHVVAMAGLWSSPFFAWYPIGVMVLTLWFDERIGWYTLVLGMGYIALYVVLEREGVYEYAPGIRARNIDEQNDISWVLGSMPAIMLFAGFCFALCLMMLASRRLQSVELARAHRKLSESSRLISRYAPAQVAERIARGEHAEVFAPERVRLTIVFSDVEGFTDASDQLDAEDLASVLNQYLSEMAMIADRHGATINQFVGDGIMIFFGAPQATDDKDHALRAVRMAVDMQRRLNELEDMWIQQGVRRPFRARVGINTGYASVGDYGSEGRKVYSAIGIQTNLAARIQADCEPGRILISDTTHALVKSEFDCIDRGEITYKGIHYPIRVFEVPVDGSVDAETG